MFWRRTCAVLEVLAVTFVLIPSLTLGTYRLFPRFETWQTATLGFAFPVFVDVVMVGVSLSLILLRREKLSSFGLNFRNAPYHLDIAATCFIPFVLAGMPLGLGVDHTRWDGALILASAQIALLFILARMLKAKPSGISAGVASLSLLLLPARSGVFGQVLMLFLTYALFVGFGEEIFYRGYVHSRLNAVFGKPYHFQGIAFGSGSLIAAAIFGLSHAGIVRWITGASSGVTLAWAFWTFFGGLVFGYVRERSGSILAPALLHGLPQAIASAVMIAL